jgi:exodeoxyribonuclease VII small subunit
MNLSDTDKTYGQVKEQLDQIVDKVSDADISLDEALALYEEAASLALLCCDLSEVDTQDEQEAQVTPSANLVSEGVTAPAQTEVGTSQTDAEKPF